MGKGTESVTRRRLPARAPDAPVISVPRIAPDSEARAFAGFTFQRSDAISVNGVARWQDEDRGTGMFSIPFVAIAFPGGGACIWGDRARTYGAVRLSSFSELETVCACPKAPPCEHLVIGSELVYARPEWFLDDLLTPTTPQPWETAYVGPEGTLVWRVERLSRNEFSVSTDDDEIANGPARVLYMRREWDCRACGRRRLAGDPVRDCAHVEVLRVGPLPAGRADAGPDEP